MKRLLSVLLVAFILVTSVVVPVAAEVTADHTVSTYDDLKNLMSAIDDNDGYAGKVIALEDDIVLGDDWNRLITGKTFKGTLDGANHTITLSNNAEMLFFQVEGATVENVTFVGTIDNFTKLKNNSQWGAISRCAHTGPLTVRNCTNKVNFTVVDSSNYVMVGAFVGDTSTAVTKITFENCHNEGTIYSGDKDGYAAGFLGRGRATEGIFFTSCTNKGSITAKGANSTSGRSGGFVAMPAGADITFSNCTNSGAVSGTGYAGGFVGHVNGKGNITFNDCSNEKEVTATSFAAGFIGGSANGTALLVEKSGNSAAITANYAGGVVGNLNGFSSTVKFSDFANSGAITAGTNAGGLVGDLRKNLELARCYNSGIITANSTSGTVSAGGLVGYCQNITVTATNCGNIGNVSCLGIASGNNGFQGFAGGIIGWAQNIAKLNECFNNGNIVGAKGAGGIIGGWCYNTANNLGYVNNCVSTGSVASAEGYTGTLGGVIGAILFGKTGNTLEVNNTYYVSDTLPALGGVAEWSAVATSTADTVIKVNGVAFEQGSTKTTAELIEEASAELVKSAKKATAAEVPNGKATVFGVQESVVENDSFNVRFVTAVNDLSYDKLIYKVSVAGDKTKTYEPTETTVVYEKILENYGNTEVLYNGEKVAADNTVGETCLGLSALTVKGVPSTGNYTFTVAVYGVIGNTEVLCDVVTMTYTAQAAA